MTFNCLFNLSSRKSKNLFLSPSNICNFRSVYNIMAGNSTQVQIKRVLIDLSGTLHIDDTPIPNCANALKRLREYDVTIRFVTNTSKESTTLLWERLQKLGFELDKKEIFSTLGAAELYIKNHKLKPIFLVAPNAMEHFRQFQLSPTEEPNAVVIGLAPTEFNYDNLNEAFRCIMQNGAKIIALNVGRYYKTPTGLSLGAGCFVKGLQYSTECEAIIIGKPSPEFFKVALENDKPEETVMIGDDIMDDIKGAMNVGINGYLVKTGKYLPGDENKLDDSPREVCTDFAEAVNIIIKHLHKK